ncbi:MAG: hypothetical protein HQ446_00155 [Polaromonas sp.]|nr:hypothetical protein [Polaromonas sp.]
MDTSGADHKLVSRLIGKQEFLPVTLGCTPNTLTELPPASIETTQCWRQSDWALAATRSKKATPTHESDLDKNAVNSRSKLCKSTNVSSGLANALAKVEGLLTAQAESIKSIAAKKYPK